jgi:D-allulose-6-phosphate 3-epimerase
MLKKISNLRQLIQEHNLEMDIQVDGQINNTTYSDVIKAGANVLVVGTSGLFTVHDDLKTAVKIVRGKINQSIIS